MTKNVHFLIDDVIWILRDITRCRPSSLFENPFMKMLKTAHDNYGVKTQMNLFYRTDSFYGNDDFSLADVTDSYKKEWEESSDWLKLGFHAKEEFPDYPLVNATYEDTKALFKNMEKEVFRFAGERSFTYGVCPHWNAVSADGVKALYDCGVQIMDVSVGEAFEYNGDPNSLPYGHAMRILNNRQPETRVYSRGGRDLTINHSVCAYNHLVPEQFEKTRGKIDSIFDEKTGMHFKRFHLSDLTLNLIPCNEIETVLSSFIGNDYIGICDHEQYFYEDYFLYQPDYADRIYKMGEFLQKNGYEFIFAEELLSR